MVKWQITQHGCEQFFCYFLIFVRLNEPFLGWFQMKYTAAFACKWVLGCKYDCFTSTKLDSGFKMLENVVIV